MLQDSGLPYKYDDRICHVEFVRTTPRKFTEKDYDRLISSDALFFRKMTDAHLNLARKIEQSIGQSE